MQSSKNAGLLVLASLTLLANPVARAAPAEGPGQRTLEESHNIEAESSPSQQMNTLAEAGIRLALTTVSQEGEGALYPFAMLYSGGENLAIVGQNPEQDQLAESEEEWSLMVMEAVREQARENPDIQAAALIRIHVATTEHGEPLPGLWAKVDHREHDPTIIFMPFYQDADNQWKLGDAVYQQPDGGFFE